MCGSRLRTVKIFVTGGTGFVGAHVVRELLDRGHEVTVLTRRPAEHEVNPAAQRVSCEWLRDDLFRQMKDCDVVIHNAVIWEREEDLEDVRASLQLFEAAADAKIKHLIYTSSTAVHRPFSALMDERMPLRTSDLYGATKAANELFLSAVADARDLPFTVFRIGPVVGNAMPGIRSNADRRLRAMIATAQEGGSIEVGAYEGRQFVGVRSLAKLYAESVLKRGQGQAYVAVAESVTAWADLAHRVVQAVGSGSVVVAPAGPEPFLFDTAKLEGDFATRLAIDPDLDEMLDEHHPKPGPTLPRL